MNDYQVKILNSERFYENTAVSNIGGVMDMTEAISVENCFLILREMVCKIRALRLQLNRDMELYEYMGKEYPIELIHIDGTKNDVMEYAQQNMKKPFSHLYDSLLFEMKIIEHNTGKMIFLKLHHLLGDAVTIAVLCNIFDEAWNNIRQGKQFECTDVSAVYPQIKDNIKKEAEKYFEQKLKSFEPVKISDKESRNCDADKISFSTVLKQNDRLVRFVSALYIYFSNITNSKKIVLGFVMANRRKKEMNMVGMFANTLPLLIGFENGTVAELEKNINSEIFNLMKYSSYTDKFQDLYDVSLSYRKQDYIPKTKSGKLVECFNGCLDTPIRIAVEEYEDNLDFDIYYKKDIFVKEFVYNMGQAILAILGNMDSDMQVSGINVLTDYDKEVYKKLNNTDVSMRYSDIMDIFADHVTKKDALIWEGGSISGIELEKKSRKIAAYIQKAKAKRVGVKMVRSPEMIETVLGALMAGASFLIISDKIAGTYKYCDLILEREQIEEICDLDGEFAEISYNPDSTAYMVCTSGTTGKPKCIEISRKSLMTRLEWANRIYGLCGTIMQKTVNTFDVSVWEMLSVIYGAKLFLLNDGWEKLPDKIAKEMLCYEIEKVHFVPSVLRRFLRYVKMHKIEFPALKEVFVSGEKLETALAKDFFECMPGKRLINLYGPAECTIDVTFYECLENNIEYDIPIGHPVDNTQIYIMNYENKCLPVGVMGEICVAGDLVGKGYIVEDSRVSMTQGGYVSLEGKKIYRTGDLGKIGFDGNIYIYGRKDSQVKVRGIRVNLSDIKNVVLKADGIADAEIINYEDRLECYYIGDGNIARIQKDIADNISVYAIPSVFERVETFPLTYSGKTDVLKLKEQRSKRDTENVIKTENRDFEEGANYLETLLLAEICKYVNVTVNDNLFDAGLDSLNVLDIVCNVQGMGYSIGFSDFYEGLTIKKIAGNIEKNKWIAYLKKNRSDSVMICFPYAGGEPQNYIELSKRLPLDMIGIYTSAFGTDVTIGSITDQIIEKLSLDEYKNIYVYGQCVGSMIAVDYACKMGKRISGIILAAPAIKGKRRLPSPWALLPNGIIKQILRMAGGKSVYTRAVLKQFRRDTNRFFKYVPDNTPLQGSFPINVIIGTRDLFTLNYKKIVHELKKLTHLEIKLHLIKNGKHFMNEANSEELCSIIRKEYPELK